MTEGWRTNAHEALRADDWTAALDGYLEVRVDARAFLQAHHALAWDLNNDRDKRDRLQDEEEGVGG